MWETQILEYHLIIYYYYVRNSIRIPSDYLHTEFSFVYKMYKIKHTILKDCILNRLVRRKNSRICSFLLVYIPCHQNYTILIILNRSKLWNETLAVFQLCDVLYWLNTNIDFHIATTTKTEKKDVNYDVIRRELHYDIQTTEIVINLSV